MTTDNSSAQWKIAVEIFARWCERAAFKPFLNFLEGGEADKAFVMTFAQADVPVRHLNTACINGFIEKVANALVTNNAPTIARILGVRF